MEASAVCAVAKTGNSTYVRMMSLNVERNLDSTPSTALDKNTRRRPMYTF